MFLLPGFDEFVLGCRSGPSAPSGFDFLNHVESGTLARTDAAAQYDQPQWPDVGRWLSCGANHPSQPTWTLNNVETSEPFRTGDDRVWHHVFDPSTRLHTVTIKNDEGDVLTSWTMTKDDVQRMASALLGCVDGTNGDPTMVVTEDAIITMQMSERPEDCDG